MAVPCCEDALNYGLLHDFGHIKSTSNLHGVENKSVYTCSANNLSSFD